jgi:signal peptidase I
MSLTVWVLIGVVAVLVVRYALVVAGRRQRAEKDESGHPSGRTKAQKGAAEPAQESGMTYRGAVEVIDSLLVALALVFFIVRLFVVQAFYIPSGSMLDTLHLHDRVIVNRFAYRFVPPRRGDIVVFKAPRSADCIGREFIKRLIGLPGDRVHVESGDYIRKGAVYINGKPIDEPYIREDPRYTFPDLQTRGGMTYMQMEFLQKADQPAVPVSIPVIDGLPVSIPDRPMFLGPIDGKDLVIPEGYYLFLGDHRMGSFDGHAWGLVPADSIVGRAEMIFWPIQRTRLLGQPLY